MRFPSLTHLQEARVTPVMILHGTLDPSTPFFWGAWAARMFQGTKANFVPVHHGPHAILKYGEVPGSSTTCGITILSSFVNNGAPDTSCISKILPLDWACQRAATKAISKELLGTEDAWEF